MKPKFYFFSVLCALILIKALTSLYDYTHDFRVDYISSPITYHPEWEIKGQLEKNEIKKIFKQPFSYLGKGGQAYAFESQDGKYVLKFVKFKFLQPRLKHQLLSLVPFFEDWNANEMERRLRKFHDFYLGYKLAFEVNPENSGLVYLHFNPTFNQFGSVILYDRKGLKHFVDLDQTVFIIQKKGEMLNDLLVKLLKTGKVQEAKQKIEKILEMYVTHYQMGLHDLGFGVIHNTGFVGDFPIHVDLGKMTWDEDIKKLEFYKEDLTVIAGKIEAWLKDCFPLHHTELSAAIEQKLSSIFNEDFSFANLGTLIR